jgi:hypothetical protein
MAIDEGMPHPAEARKFIELLRSRRGWVETKIAKRKADGLPTGFDVLELHALDWALPVLEAEWDNLARQHRNVQRVNRRLKSNRPGSTQTELRTTPKWEEPA